MKDYTLFATKDGKEHLITEGANADKWVLASQWALRNGFTDLRTVTFDPQERFSITNMFINTIRK